MKRWYVPALACLALVAGLTANAQIPNASFETWAAGSPAGWVTNNAPPLATPIVQSATARTGSSSMKGQVVDFMGMVSYGPVAWTTAPYTQRPAALTGYYQFTSVQSDSFGIYLYMKNAGAAIAAGFFESGVQRTTWTQFTAPLEYISGESPDSVYIEVLILPGANDSLHVGSQFLLDDLAFTGSATAVAADAPIPSAYALGQNYPNPFNPSTVIRYELPAGGPVRLSVFTLLGQSIATLVDGEQPAGIHEVRFDASGLPSGMYLYRIQAGSFVQTRKMTLMR